MKVARTTYQDIDRLTVLCSTWALFSRCKVPTNGPKRSKVLPWAAAKMTMQTVFNFEPICTMYV